MIELKDKRTHSTKHYSLDNGRKLLVSHAGHIHYDNKLGLGDGKKGYRELDYNLVWDNNRRVWFFNFGSFQPTIPEYADDWCTFRDLYKSKDQEVSYRPICNHVQGRLVPVEQLIQEGLQQEMGFNCVIYDDAFGAGLDLIYAFQKSGLKKLVRIRKGTTPKDYQFTFEYSSTKPLNSKDGQLYFGEDSSDDVATPLQPFLVWAAMWVKVVSVDLFVENNKTFFRKNVDASFIQEHNDLDIFTDTTTTFYSGLDRRLIREVVTGETWATHRAGAGVTTYTALYLSLTAHKNAANSYDNLSRITLNFDTSGLSDLAVVSEVIFSIYGGGAEVNNIPLSDANGGITISQGYSASDTSLVASDFNVANLYTTRWADDMLLSEINNSGYNDFTLNASGIAGVNLTGYTKISMRNPYDFDNSSPDDSAARQDYYIPFKGAVTSGTSQDPKLAITYTEGSAPVTDKMFLVF